MKYKDFNKSDVSPLILSINMMGENEETGPKKPVRLTPPKFPKRKSATPRATNIYPNICMLICY